jgi:energy-coupling factor transporter ATP-binding protein EcfA2
MTVMDALTLNRQLFADLDDSSVRYCHFKSNEHLEAALLGRTDLDLLVDPAHREAFESRVVALGFKRFAAPAARQLPGVVDYLGLDELSGALVHLHVHYRLILGEKRVKDHYLPIEGSLLDRCRTLSGVRAPSPEDELVLLYVRAHLKIDLRERARLMVRRPPVPYPPGTHREMEWLAEQADSEVIDAAAEAWGIGIPGRSVSEFVDRIRTGRLDVAYALERKRALLRTLRPYRRHPGIAGVARKAWFAARFSRPVRTVAPVAKRLVPGGGPYVALVGADGSGKSTLVTDLAGWLGQKVETRVLYFGIPKESVGLRLRAGAAARLSTLSHRLREARLDPLASRAHGAAEALRRSRWLSLARHRRALDARARRLQRKGAAVIAERFPLREFWSMDTPMDGPRLGDPAGNGHRPRGSARERAIYETIGPPDQVIVLSAGLDSLLRRKPELTAATHRQKVDAVALVAERGGHEVIDAERPYDEVLLEAKRVVWRLL